MSHRRAPGVLYRPGFVSPGDREELVRWLSDIHPIWEDRYPDGSPRQRSLLRPVYWLGAWQFACLDYYHPPDRVHDRAVRAEPFPPVLARLVAETERIARASLDRADVPAKWRLNTCLVNLYGARISPDGRKIDVARVGEHRDYEPGPVASISLGERALFQFVRSSRPGTRGPVVLQQWLDDRSLQIFAGEHWKRRAFHRVQRVDRKLGLTFDIPVEGFVTRRVNFTFRWIPDEHIVDLAKLAPTARKHVARYVDELARHSEFWRSASSAAAG